MNAVFRQILANENLAQPPELGTSLERNLHLMIMFWLLLILFLVPQDERNGPESELL